VIARYRASGQTAEVIAARDGLNVSTRRRWSAEAGANRVSDSEIGTERSRGHFADEPSRDSLSRANDIAADRLTAGDSVAEDQ